MNLEQITTLQEKSPQLIQSHQEIFSNLDTPIMGCLSSEHAPILKDIIDKTQSKNILEIGFNIGSSCISWLLASPKVNVASIDIHNPEQSVKCITEKFPGRFTFFRMDSKDISSEDFKNQFKNKLDLIFIDGDHSEEMVTLDLNNALELNPKYIVFDDVTHWSHPYIKTIMMNHPKLELIETYELGTGIALTKVKYN